MMISNIVFVAIIYIMFDIFSHLFARDTCVNKRFTNVCYRSVAYRLFELKFQLLHRVTLLFGWKLDCHEHHKAANMYISLISPITLVDFESRRIVMRSTFHCDRGNGANMFAIYALPLTIISVALFIMNGAAMSLPILRTGQHTHTHTTFNRQRDQQTNK